MYFGGFGRRHIQATALLVLTIIISLHTSRMRIETGMAVTYCIQSIMACLLFALVDSQNKLRDAQ